MQRPQKSKPAQSRRKKGTRYTLGDDNEVARVAKQEYFIAQNLDLTPHKTKPLKSALAQPILNARYKYMQLEGSITGSELSSVAFTQLINSAQGTTDSTRIGDRIRIRRIRFCGKLTGGTAATGPVAARVMMILWTVPGVGQTNFPITGMIIQAGAGRYPLGGYARDYVDEFQVLHDSLNSVQPASTTAEADFVFFERNMLADVQFSAAATAPNTNALYLSVITDVTTAVNVQPTMSYNVQVLYEDNDA